MPGAPRRRWSYRPGDLGRPGGVERSLAPLDRDWDTLEELPGAVVLKSNPVREVIALPLASERPAVVVKRYRVRGRADRLAHLFRPSRARREWRALRALEAAGLPTPRPLGWFEDRRGPWLAGAGLVMERLEGVVPLPELVHGAGRLAGSAAAAAAGDPEGAAERRLRATGALVARLHQAGIAHPDLHLGNFLGAPGDPGDVRLVDVHAASIGRSVLASRRRRDLAKLVHSIGEDPGARRGRIVIAAYLGAAGSGILGSVEDELRRIGAAARAIERTRLASRDRRCWGTTSQFVAERRGRHRVHRRRTIAPEALAPLLDGSARPLRALAAPPGRTRAELAITTSAGSRIVVVETAERGFLRGLLDRARRGPLARAWGAARRLEVRGVPHARSLAYIAERRFGAIRREILVTERLAGRTLEDEIRARAESPRELARFLRRAADEIAPVVATLHVAGLCHGGLGAAHWLVVDGAAAGEGAPAGSFALLALDRVRPRGALGERERRRDLIDLALLPFGLGTARLRLRFLRRYLALAPLRSAARLDPELAERRVMRIEALAARELARAGSRAETASRRAGAVRAPLARPAGAPGAGRAP